jgi:hypothetical protein
MGAFLTLLWISEYDANMAIFVLLFAEKSKAALRAVSGWGAPRGFGVSSGHILRQTSTVYSTTQANLPKAFLNFATLLVNRRS